MPALIILLGVALLALGFWSQRRVNAMKKASLSWPTTPGTIIAATLENRESGAAETGKTQFTVFCADYTYSVNGVDQKGHWESGEDKRFAELQAKYAAGSRVMIHYDPKKPGHGHARTDPEGLIVDRAPWIHLRDNRGLHWGRVVLGEIDADWNVNVQHKAEIQMKAKFFGLMAASMVLAGCGSGVQAPASVQGTWGADCTSPFIKIGESQIHVYPDKADYDLKSVKVDGANVTFGYDSSAGAVTETYVIEGDTLRLDHGTYAGSDATWHKQPMKKC